MAKTTGGQRIEDHFAAVSKMVETQQCKRLGKAEMPAKKKSATNKGNGSIKNVNCNQFRAKLTIL